MAEEYNINLATPDYGYDWMTPQEESPFDFGGDTDWGITDTSNWDIFDDRWNTWQPPEGAPVYNFEEEEPWLNPDFNFEEEWGMPSSLYDDPFTQIGGYSINTEPSSLTDYGNIMDEGWADWAGTQNWSDPLSLRELLGEEVDYSISPDDPMYEYYLSQGMADDPYGMGASMDQFFGDQYGDAWRSPYAVGDDPLAGFNFDAEGNITPYDYGIGSLFPGAGPGAGPQAPQGPGAATEGRFPAIRSAFQSMFGLGPAGPNAAGVTGRRRPQSPFAGGLGVTPEWFKRIGDKIGLGGRSGLQDAYVTGYPEETGQGIFGGGGLGSLFGGDGDGGGQGGGMGNWMMPLGLGILAAQATKDDRGVDLTPSVTMDPLGRYTLSGAGPEERREFGLGEIPTSLDFSAYEDLMGGS
jgi:hypothetical protein